VWRGEIFQWFNPFPRVVFAGLAPAKLYYGANQIDDVFHNLSSVYMIAFMDLEFLRCGGCDAVALQSGIFVLEASVVHLL